MSNSVFSGCGYINYFPSQQLCPSHGGSGGGRGAALSSVAWKWSRPEVTRCLAV